MARDKTREVAIQESMKIKEKAEVNESYFVGLLWSNPIEFYNDYHDLLSRDKFMHPQWGFFFDLGQMLYNEGVRNFDSITVAKYANENGFLDEFKSYGGYKTIADVTEIVNGYHDNIEHYYEIINKNYTLKQLYLLFGDKVFIKTKRYDHTKMSAEILSTYWNDKANQIALSEVGRYEAENLYINADIFIEKLEDESADMLPFFNGHLLNKVTQGLARGHVTMFGGFGNTGKSSIASEKVVMSYIQNKEKAIILLNEEDAQSFRQKIVLSLLYHEFSTGIDRKRMVNGKLTDKDKDKIRMAFTRMEELIDGEEAMIKVIFMEKYVIADLEKIIRFWANRGYYNLVIDTHKVSDESKHSVRWETFVEDMKSIYRMTRANAGGMNLRTFVTFQLADSAIRSRYLGFDAIGEGKAAKNEASVVLMFRPVWSDEYDGEKQELDCWTWERNELTGDYEKKPFTLEKGKSYSLMFTPKNRFGANNDNGQTVLILESQFNANHFKEVGHCFVAKDYSY